MPRKHSKCLACGENTAAKGSNICDPCYEHHFGPDWIATPVEPRHSQAIARRGARIIEQSRHHHNAAKLIALSHKDDFPYLVTFGRKFAIRKTLKIRPAKPPGQCSRMRVYVKRTYAKSQREFP